MALDKEYIKNYFSTFHRCFSCTFIRKDRSGSAPRTLHCRHNGAPWTRGNSCVTRKKITDSLLYALCDWTSICANRTYKNNRKGLALGVNFLHLAVCIHMSHDLGAVTIFRFLELELGIGFGLD